jgi:hypothetical protein
MLLHGSGVAENSATAHERRFQQVFGGVRLPCCWIVQREPEACRNWEFAVLKTKTDDKFGWLAAGQTLGRLALQARAIGSSCTFFTDALRDPLVREDLRTSVGHKGYVQAILRFQRPRHRIQMNALSDRYACSPTVVAAAKRSSHLN